jgi:filamentous hemagglutinin
MSVTPRGRILTEHAQESLLRHGFKEPFDLVDDIIDSCTHQTTQRDGATVYIQRTRGRTRRYNIVIEGEEGIVTAMRNLKKPELDNLGRRHGFNPNI